VVLTEPGVVVSGTVVSMAVVVGLVVSTTVEGGVVVCGVDVVTSVVGLHGSWNPETVLGLMSGFVVETVQACPALDDQGNDCEPFPVAAMLVVELSMVTAMFSGLCPKSVQATDRPSHPGSMLQL
jgi:hypothetical protein